MSQPRDFSQMPFCLHCQQNRSQKRGLCMRCYRDDSIRAQYPPRNKNGQPLREPTWEEVEAMVAANYPTMPTGAAAADRPHERVESIRRFPRK